MQGYETFGDFLQQQWQALLFLLVGTVMIVYCIVKVIQLVSKRQGEKVDKKDEKDYERLLLSLSRDAREIDVNGLTIEIRDCIDRESGQLDPRTAFAANLTREEFRKNRTTIHKGLRDNEIHLFGPSNPDSYSTLEYLRTQFGWVTEDLSCGVNSERITIEGSHQEIDLYKYEAPSLSKERPCIVFFHGGGFFGGVIPTVENQCKLLAELLGGVVIAVDYPLAPESKFPIGLDCCYESVEWVHENAESLGVDPRRIGVAGDSAGGNLALVCALRARDEKKDFIRYMGLIYPTVSQAVEEGDDFYYFDEKAYENSENDPYIAEQIVAIKKSNHLLKEWYLEEGTDPMQPYISPITASMRGMPKALVMTAEYDYLRMECEELSRKLKEAGVEQRHMRYGGIVHGTFDRLGYAPQVEDMLREMAKDMRRLK